MSEIIKIGITSSNNKKIEEVSSIQVLANQGISFTVNQLGGLSQGDFLTLTSPAQVT